MFYAGDDVNAGRKFAVGDIVMVHSEPGSNYYGDNLAVVFHQAFLERRMAKV